MTHYYWEAICEAYALFQKMKAWQKKCIEEFCKASEELNGCSYESRRNLLEIYYRKQRDMNHSDRCLDSQRSLICELRDALATCIEW